MRKLLIIISFLVGMSLNAQDKEDFLDCVQEFFDCIADINEAEGTDMVHNLQRKYEGRFFHFNNSSDVGLNVFLGYYKKHVLGNAIVTHDILELKHALTMEGTQSYQLRDVKIRRTFDFQDSIAISLHYSDTITCNMLVTWMREDATPRIRINGISYFEPLEKTPQVIAIRRTPILKVSKAYTTVSSHSGSHHVSVISYCDTESIYTNGSSKLIHRDTLEFKVIGNNFEVKNNEVKFDYSSNPLGHERLLNWTLEQKETGATCVVLVRQEKRKSKIGLF